jgi:RES domain-containing protein
MPALYMSADLATAVAEYEQELGIRPGTFCAYDVNVAGILDLCDNSALAACSIDPAVRFAPWKSMLLVDKGRPPGWDIAERLIAAGAAGILVPSVRLAGGVNLVLWRWNDGADRTVNPLDPQRDLPRDQSSWPVIPTAAPPVDHFRRDRNR